MTSNIDTLKKRVFSMFIITILGLQTMPILTEGTNYHWGDYYWPFTNYPMYNGGHQEGEYVKVGNSITATLANGKQISLTYQNPEVLGLNFFTFQHKCEKLLRPDGHLYVDELTSLHPLGDQIVQLDIYNYPVIVTRDGPKEAEQLLLKSIVFNSQGQGTIQ